MLSQDCLSWGQSENCIRDLTAYALQRKAQLGADRVFDFSIGNPSVPAPQALNDTMLELLRGDLVALHSYTPAAGLMAFRQAIADDLKRRHGLDAPADGVYVSCGASAGLAICCRALLRPGEKLLAFAPFFPEYRVFTEAAGGVFVPLPPAAGLQPDLDALERALDQDVAVVLVNTPNNPSGVVLSEESLRRMAALLEDAQRRFGRPIYLVSDEPYRELVYDGAQVPSPLRFYGNGILCYSYSKSLSLPGERLGYLAVSGAMEKRAEVFAALCGAGRALGYVNAPSLLQQAVTRCIELCADVSIYRKNRDLLYEGLCALGFDCVYPDGAFYLFVRAPLEDAKAFSELAKRHELILVPSDDFGLGGYVRLAYCVSEEMIRRALPAFAALARDCGLTPRG